MRAFVAGGIDFGETDRVVRLLTADEGRVAVLARGVRGGRKKQLSATLSAGNLLDLDLKRGKGPLRLVVDATIVATAHRARQDLVRLAQLAYGVEVCAELAPENHEAAALFKLLSSWLARVEAPEAPGRATRQAFEAKALTFAGLSQSLVGCAVCGERLAEPAVYSFEAGGGTHGRCATGRPVRVDALTRLEALRRSPLAVTPGVAPTAPPWLLADAIEWHLGKAVNSRSLLEEVETDETRP